jgi:hypothetical protein
MALDNFIVSDFVKATTEKKKKNETTVFGTVNSYTDSDGRKYVKMDGAEELTPVMTTAELKEGDRVAILVKDHSAVIMGNITSQSASTNTVEKVKETATTAKSTADTAHTTATDTMQKVDDLEERANNGEFKGSDGRGIVNITEYYLVSPSSSGITTSTSGWSTDIQGMTSYKKYLWNYRKTTYTTGDPTITTPCIIGTYGEKGDPGAQGETGATGRSVKEIVDQYAKSSSSSIAPVNSDFSEQIPEWSSGEYIWRRQKITWLLSDGTTDTSYTNPIADMAFSTLFTQDIYMTGTFTTTRQLYLMPTVTEYNKVKGYTETGGSKTFISDEEFYKFDVDHNGSINEFELAWFHDAVFSRGTITIEKVEGFVNNSMEELVKGFPDYDASTKPYTSEVTFTISLQKPDSIIQIVGTNLWGSKIDCRFGANNLFVSANGSLDKVQLEVLLSDSDIIKGLQTSVGSIKIDDVLSSTSTNPVQNKVVKEALDTKLDKKLIINYTEDDIQVLWDEVFSS